MHDGRSESSTAYWFRLALVAGLIVAGVSWLNTDEGMSSVVNFTG